MVANKRTKRKRACSKPNIIRGSSFGMKEFPTEEEYANVRSKGLIIKEWVKNKPNDFSASPKGTMWHHCAFLFIPDTYPFAARYATMTYAEWVLDMYHMARKYGSKSVLRDMYKILLTLTEGDNVSQHT